MPSAFYGVKRSSMWYYTPYRRPRSNSIDGFLRVTPIHTSSQSHGLLYGGKSSRGSAKASERPNDKLKPSPQALSSFFLTLEDVKSASEGFEKVLLCVWSPTSEVHYVTKEHIGQELAAISQYSWTLVCWSCFKKGHMKFK